MKKSLIALAVLATAGTAFAQSSMILSGNIGTDYSRGLTGSAALADSGGGNTGFALSGTEDLGGGLKATVYMQQRFNSVTGANGNSVIVTPASADGTAAAYTQSRGVQNINVGLSSAALGAVNIGRIATGSLSAYDAFGGYGALTYAYANAGSARNDNTIQYTAPTVSGFSLTLATTNNANAAEYTYVQAKYTNGPLSLAILRDETAAGAENLSIGGSYNLGVATVMVLNGKATTAANVSTSNTSVGVVYPMGAMTFKASVRSGDTANQSAVGVDYALSKRTGLYAHAMSQSGAAQTAFRLGLKHSF